MVIEIENWGWGYIVGREKRRSRRWGSEEQEDSDLDIELGQSK